MEMNKQNHFSVEEESSEVVPSLIKAITANEVAGFDSSKEHDDLESQLKSVGLNPLSTSAFPPVCVGDGDDLSKTQMGHSVSISMPHSPTEAHLQNTNRGFFKSGVADSGKESSNSAAKYYSQPMPKGSVTIENSSDLPVRNPRMDKLKDKRFDSFKTWSGRLERQLSNLRGIHIEVGEDEPAIQPHTDFQSLRADRYFDALEGPELDTLRASEEILLPQDEKWPFLLRFPISSFGICLGVSSQAILWKALATSESTEFLYVNKDINLVLWFISVALIAIVAFTYLLKIVFFFEAVRREYYHPIRVNFFFAPFIALLFLALGVPPSICETLPGSLWYVLMTPFLCLELKIYGQWMSGGHRRLSKVANPSNHLAVVGNFVGALLGASMGLKEGPVFFFAVGLAHYVVLFVTLYQRLPTNEALPRELHPVFFLFVAAPSVASMAWAKIQDSFDYGSRIAFFIALFLYFSLAVRVNFFRGFRFSLAWWAYTFPMTGAAIATIRYATVVPCLVTKCLTVALSSIAVFTVMALLLATIIHAFVLGDLFPNDVAIAISQRKPKTTKKWYIRRSGSSERYLKYTNSNAKDIESSVTKCTDEAKNVEPVKIVAP